MATERYRSVDLQKWLINKAVAASAPYARRLITSNDQRGRDSTMVGKLYFFKYDPLYKDTLSEYDKFPMCFPLEPPTVTKSGLSFLGINLHYLTGYERQKLLGKLLEYKNNKYMDERTKLNLSYQLISSTRSLNSLARPCVKRYLFSHVRSRFIEIYPDEYQIAAQLPVADWVFNR